MQGKFEELMQLMKDYEKYLKNTFYDSAMSQLSMTSYNHKK